MAKIMLVEDDKSLREIYGVRLAAEGYEIISAGDGEEALAMAVKERPDLILSDVMMPKISGFDMLDIIRATPETKDMKVIMMTALSSEDQRSRGESLGANKYLVKSQVGIEDVVRAVHEILGDIPVAAPPKPVEFTTPIATETINTAPVQPEVAAAASAEPAPAIDKPTEEEVTPTEPQLAVSEEVSLPQPNQAPSVPNIAEPITPEPQPEIEATPVAPAPAPTPVETPAPVAPEPTVEPAPATAQPEVPVQTTTVTPTPQPEMAPPVAPATQPTQPIDNELPQPTAPFSTETPKTPLGERIINPLNPVDDKPDISSLMDQALNEGQPSTEPPAPTPPQV